MFGFAEPEVKLPEPAACQVRALIVEDVPADVELDLRALRADGIEAKGDVAQSAKEFTDLVRQNSYDVVLADFNLPNWSGMETVDILRQEGLDIPVILVSGALGELRAVECIKKGAADYVLKDQLTRLPEALRRALREKKLRAEHKRAHEDLARSNQDLEQFAYVASHDLQEPLRMVANYTQLLAEKYRGKLDPQADKYIDYAVDGATRMQALIKDLLQFSRVGQAEVGAKTADCGSVVQQALKNLHSTVEENAAVVQWNGLPTVNADPAQLVLVFQNLISNAIKFRGDDPPVVQINAEKNDREWTLSVSDNGIGIPPENAQDIFVIFRRLHTRTEYAGNGIGLSICKKIIERHGGNIWSEPQVKSGCRFCFTLPEAFPATTHARGVQA